MNRYTWRLALAGLVALLALVGIASAANAAWLAPAPAGAPPVGALPFGPLLATADPFVANFDCSQIHARGIDTQTNIRAELIRARCGAQVSAPGAGAVPVDPHLARPFSPGLGAGDVDAVLPDNNYPNVVQRESVIAAHGSTLVLNYDDTHSASSCYAGLAYSTDGGTTWQHDTAAGLLCAGHGTNYGSPVVVWDAAHNQFVAGDITTGCGGQGVGLWTSPDGITWTPGACAVNVAGGDGDRETMYVDNNPASPYYGTMFISYADYANSGPPISVVRSTDGGATWSAPQTLALPTGVSFVRNVQGTAGPDGTFFIVGMDENGGGLNPRTNYIYRSTDGGATWGSPIQMGAPFPAPGAVASGYGARFFPSGWNYFGWGQPGVGPRGVVHYAYTQHGAGSDPGDLMYTRSTDNGSTWSTPIRLNTDTSGNGNWEPSLAVTAAGAVLVSWYDGRNGASADCGSPGGTAPCYERWGRVSLANGATWQADADMSSAISPLPGVPGSPGQATSNDYDYAAADGTNGYTCWADGRVLIQGASQADIFCDRVDLSQATPTPVPPTATPVPPATPTATPTPGAPPCTIEFSDVHPSDYFYQPVHFLACRGAISGYADGTFRPFSGTTRSQVVKIVMLGFQKPLQTPAADYTFADVPRTFPYFAVIETAAALHLVSGYTCGGPGEPCDAQHRPYFRPYANLTRGQMTKIIVVAAGWPLIYPPNRTFEDVLPGSAFYPFVETAATHMIISGYACGAPPAGPCIPPLNRPYFLPNGTSATRGQIAKLIYLTITNP